MSNVKQQAVTAYWKTVRAPVLTGIVIYSDIYQSAHTDSESETIVWARNYMVCDAYCLGLFNNQHPQASGLHTQAWGAD